VLELYKIVSKAEVKAKSVTIQLTHIVRVSVSLIISSLFENITNHVLLYEE
jgi:hypothetical protein